MTKAVEAYHALCTAGKWHVPSTAGVNEVVCQNCGPRGHSYGECKKSRDQARIDAAKKLLKAGQQDAQDGEQQDIHSDF